MQGEKFTRVYAAIFFTFHTKNIVSTSLLKINQQNCLEKVCLYKMCFKLLGPVFQLKSPK